jgi:hypothetical protein
MLDGVERMEVQSNGWNCLKAESRRLILDTRRTRATSGVCCLQGSHRSLFRSLSTNEAKRNCEALLFQKLPNFISYRPVGHLPHCLSTQSLPRLCPLRQKWPLGRWLLACDRLNGPAARSMPSTRSLLGALQHPSHTAQRPSAPLSAMALR